MVDNADDEWVEGTIQYYMQAIQNYASSQDEAVDEIFSNIQQHQELTQIQLQRYYSTHEERAKDEVLQLFRQYWEYFGTIQLTLQCFQLCAKIQQQLQIYSSINKYQLQLYNIINKSQSYNNAILRYQRFDNTSLRNQLVLDNAIQNSQKFYNSIQRKIQYQLQYYAWQDGVEDEIRIQDLQLQFQLSMQLFCTIGRSSFDQQIRQLGSTILISQQLIRQIRLSSVQQSQDETGIQRRQIRKFQLYNIQMQVQQLHNLLVYNINRKQIVQKILNFYVDKVVDGHKVTPENVDRCLRNNGVGPELFTEISNIIDHSTYNASNYHHHNEGRCNWNEEASNTFGLIIGKYDEHINRLKTNHGNIKTGFWEYVSFILLSEYGYNYSPAQCALRHKNNLRLNSMVTFQLLTR